MSGYRRPTLLVSDSVLIYAVRYAIGRKTYAVGDVCQSVVENKQRLDTKTIKCIMRDIYIAKDLGSDIDKQHWQELVEYLQYELIERETKSVQ